MHPRQTDVDRTFAVVIWIFHGDADRTALPNLNELASSGTRLILSTRAETAHSIIDTIDPRNRKRSFVITDDGEKVIGFNHRGDAMALSRQSFATAVAAMQHLLQNEVLPLGVVTTDILVLIQKSGTTNDLDTDALLSLAELRHSRFVFDVDSNRASEILREQLAITERLGAFAPCRDPAWVIVESGFDVAREHEIESLLAIANGYVGVRGSIAEGSSVSRPATLLAGAFEPSSDVSSVPELVIAPDWGRLRFTIEGEPFMAWSTTVTRHRRTLDMRRGMLLREGFATGSGGHTTEIRTLHVASMSRRHLLLEGVEIMPVNFSGTVVIDAILSGDVKSESGSAHWKNFEPKNCQSGPMLVGTTHNGLTVAMSSHTTEADSDCTNLVNCGQATGPSWATERCDYRVRLGQSSVLYRVVGLFTSRDESDPISRAEALTEEVARRPFTALVSDHEAEWSALWKRCNVEIDGAPKIERALRFAMYHLLAAVNPMDCRTSIGARALSGEAYRGHIFWDTEIFMLPFYVHVWPEAARTLLCYRHRTLDGARRNAKRLGFQGALFAWESADTGDETTPEMAKTPSGEIVRILSGLEEHHISADIAHAVSSYARASGDMNFLQNEGAEILMETARFWASRVTLERDGQYHIQKIIGPDEYHESVDDNAFTNWMARKNLRRAVHVARTSRQTTPTSLDVSSAEIDRWEHIAAHMYLGLDDRTQMIEQHRGFFELEEVDLSAFAPRTAPIDVLIGRDRTRASQVIKQADVVQLLALLWDEVDARARRKNFLYYEPRTAHGSSLSPGVHALVAARLGLVDMAARYLEQTADIDLGNTMGNAAGGVHAAAMGSLWQAVAFGVAGVHADPNDPDVLFVNPNLLPNMRRVSLPFALRGRTIELHVCRNEIEAHVREGQAPIGLSVCGPGESRQTILAEPNRSYAAKRGQDGYSAWEEIDG